MASLVSSLTDTVWNLLQLHQSTLQKCDDVEERRHRAADDNKNLQVIWRVTIVCGFHVLHSMWYQVFGTDQYIGQLVPSYHPKYLSPFQNSVSLPLCKIHCKYRNFKLVIPHSSVLLYIDMIYICICKNLIDCVTERSERMYYTYCCLNPWIWSLSK